MNRTALGQRKTRQRDVIVRVIQESNGPLTVHEILDRAQTDMPGLGIATVYRTLNLLLEARRIHTVILPSGETRYEPSGRGHHHHFQCRACDKVFDVDECPVAVEHSAIIGGGWVIEGHELTLYGLCPECGPP